MGPSLRAAVLVAALAAAGCSPPAAPRAGASPPATSGPSSHATQGEYAEFLPFARGEVAFDRAVRAGRPALVLFTADG